MKYYFKNEIKRAIFSKTALLSFSISLILLIISFLEFINFPTLGIMEAKQRFDAIDIFVRIRSTSNAAFIIVVFPLLSTIIFSDSYLLEKETGFIKFIYLRISTKRYVFIKSIVNAIVSALVGILSSFTMLIFLICTYGIRVTNKLNIEGPFSYLLNSNRLKYAFILVAITGLSYMVFSTLALGISAWIKNRYLVLILPFFYYIFCGTILDVPIISNFFNFNFSRIYSLNSAISLAHVFIYSILLLLLGETLFYIGVVLKNEKDL